jgi:hypothetical protein
VSVLLQGPKTKLFELLFCGMLDVVIFASKTLTYEEVWEFERDQSARSDGEMT